MREILNVNYNGVPIYDIIIEENYEQLYKELIKLDAGERRICIVSDSNVASLYLNEVKKITDTYTKQTVSFIFTAGEESKNLDTVKNLYKYLIENSFDRNDILIALGGGVVGDLTGFAAATYLRGIRFIQLPTSLLSMVDSSIGGKTGVDFDAYKNMVGAFHQPKSVYINLSVLNTLDDRQFSSGMAEIIKHGLIKDINYYKWLEEHKHEILEKNFSILSKMIYTSCVIKKNVVENDPTEKGERALLNFGHTIGHSIEKIMNFNLLHGECVALGIAAANEIAWKRGLISEYEMKNVNILMNDFGLKTKVSISDIDEVIKTTKHDKKMEAGKIKFILLNKLGEAVIEKNVTDIEMSEAVVSIISG